jgi:hypothetical protein
MRSCKLALLGLFLLAVSTAQAQNIVTNPGFETGDFTGWTLTGTGASAVDEVDPGVGRNGSFAASLGAVAPDVDELSQTLATQVGQQYDLTFFAQTPEFNNPPGFPNSLSVYFGGNLIAGPLTVPDNPDFEQYSSTVTATSTTSLLRFVISNDPDYTQLDDISVTAVGGAAVPEPSLLALLLSSGSGGIWLLRRRRH